MWCRISPRWAGRTNRKYSPPKTCPEHRHLAWKRSLREARSKTIEATRDLPLPSTKKCNDPRCVNVNPQPAENFYLVKRRLQSTGELRYSLAAYCKTCSRRRSNEHRTSLSSEERQKRDKERNERYDKKHGTENRREIKRKSKKRVRSKKKIAEDPPYMPDFKMSDVPGGPKDPQDYLPSGPFVEWLTGKNGYLKKSIPALAEAMQINRKVLDRLVTGREWDTYNQKEVKVTDVHKSIVDRALVADGLNTQPWQLYDVLGE